MEKEETKGTAIIIGRFQVPYLHLGHIYLISKALQEYDKVVILLGESLGRNARNPYSILARSEMIWRVFPQVKIRTVMDIPGDDEAWSWKVDKRISGGGFENPILLHSRDSFVGHYTGVYPLREIEELPGYSGTELRKKVNNGKDQQAFLDL